MKCTILGKILLLCLVLGQMCGCASTVKDTTRYFWPPLPDVPRIEWLGVYNNIRDLKEETFLDRFVGSDVEISLQSPMFAVSDGDGKIYVTDQRLGGLVLFDIGKKSVEFVGGPEGESLFLRPSGLAIDGEGNVYVGDLQTKKITVFSRDQKVKQVLDLSQEVKNPGFFTIDKPRRRLIVPDIWGQKIVVFDLNGKLINSVGKRGEADGEFNYPTSVAVDKEGNIIVCDTMNARIQRFNSDLKFLSKFGKRGDGPGEFNIIKAVAVDSEGHIYVTDAKSRRFNIFNEQGELLLPVGGSFALSPGSSVTPGGFLLPQGIWIDQNDRIYVTDQMNARVQSFQYLNEKYLREQPIPVGKTAK